MVSVEATDNRRRGGMMNNTKRLLIFATVIPTANFIIAALTDTGVRGLVMGFVGSVIGLGVGYLINRYLL